MLVDNATINLRSAILDIAFEYVIERLTIQVNTNVARCV